MGRYFFLEMEDCESEHSQNMKAHLNKYSKNAHFRTTLTAVSQWKSKKLLKRVWSTVEVYSDICERI